MIGHFQQLSLNSVYLRKLSNSVTPQQCSKIDRWVIEEKLRPKVGILLQASRKPTDLQAVHRERQS